MLTLADLDFLTSARGETLLHFLAMQDLSEANRLGLVSSLRKTYTMLEVSSAITLAHTRLRAVSKFGERAMTMFFTPDAYEQASDPAIRAYRAGYFADKQVYDMCCGIGADSMALAGRAHDVIGIDKDPVRIAMARLNADRLGMTHLRYEIGDVTAYELPDSHTFFF